MLLVKRMVVASLFVRSGDTSFKTIKCTNCGLEFESPYEKHNGGCYDLMPLDFNYCPMCGEKIEK